MTPEEQRIAIAEFCGWKAKHRSDMCDGVRIIKCGACGVSGHSNCFGDGTGRIQFNCADSPCCEEATPPNYLEDLNAIHEAENCLLTDASRDIKETWLGHLTALAILGATSAESATAAQRCETLLKSIGKWKD